MNQSKRMKWGRQKPVLVSLLILGGSTAVMAQVTAAVTGTIQDASGAAVPKAMLTVTSLETGIARTVTADDTGYYQVLALPVGRYQLRGQKTGFKTAWQ